MRLVEDAIKQECCLQIFSKISDKKTQAIVPCTILLNPQSLCRPFN